MNSTSENISAVCCSNPSISEAEFEASLCFSVRPFPAPDPAQSICNFWAEVLAQLESISLVRQCPKSQAEDCKTTSTKRKLHSFGKLQCWQLKSHLSYF